MKDVRSQAIAEYVKRNKSCSMAELMEHFKVSQATIHRDVAELVRQGFLRKVRGGAVCPGYSEPDDRMTVLSPGFQDRMLLNQARKIAISDLAVREIVDGDILFLDSSTTVFFLAERLLQCAFTNLTVITNSALIIQNFHKFPARYVLIATGGTFDPQLNSFLGQSALHELGGKHIMKAFVSAFGTADGNAATNHEYHALFIKTALEFSEKKYLLIDRDKLGRTGLFPFLPCARFDRIITDPAGSEGMEE